jgi:hypothetical protein
MLAYTGLFPVNGNAQTSHGPAARSHRQKAEILARFKESNARSAPFFLVCVGMALVNNISS